MDVHPMTVALEVKPCRVHPAVEHYQLAVCPWDAKTLNSELECPDGCHVAVRGPSWRCIQWMIDHQQEVEAWLATQPEPHERLSRLTVEQEERRQ